MRRVGKSTKHKNKNCLAGMRCPCCGALEPYDCKKEPEFFLEVIHRQTNEVGRDGAYIDTRDGDVEYQCRQCFNTAPWCNELN